MARADSPAVQTSKAVAAFQDYLGMGAERSLTKLAQGMGPSGTQWSLISLQRWSSAFGWVEKARAHDETIATKARKRADAGQIARAADARTRRLDRAGKLGEIVDIWTDDKLANPEKAARLSGKVIAELAQHAAETERMDSEDPAERIAQSREQLFRVVIEQVPPTPKSTALHLPALNDLEEPPFDGEFLQLEA